MSTSFCTNWGERWDVNEVKKEILLIWDHALTRHRLVMVRGCGLLGEHPLGMQKVLGLISGISS